MWFQIYYLLLISSLITLSWYPSTEAILWTFGKVWRHLVVLSWAEWATGVCWVEARDTAEHPGTRRTAPTAKNDPTPNAVGLPLRNGAKQRAFVGRQLCASQPC